jgi:hypothetical protein
VRITNLAGGYENGESGSGILRRNAMRGITRGLLTGLRSNVEQFDRQTWRDALAKQNREHDAEHGDANGTECKLKRHQRELSNLNTTART